MGRHLPALVVGQGEAQRCRHRQQSRRRSHRTEVESGKRADRPQLAAALELCRRQRAMLVIAKLDRLARNVAFIANLMDPASSSPRSTCPTPTS